MNFEPVSVLRTKIKEEEDDISNIIDLDLDKSPEDLVYEWNSKVRLKFKNYIVDSEQSLDILMKWYIKMTKEEAVNFEDFHTLKLFTTNHMQFFKLYFIELNCCFMDNYLDNMEEILSFYVNLEVKTLPAKQKDDNKRAYKKVWRKIISILSLYLLNREDRISHVIMKVKLNLQTEGSRDLLNLLYGNFLTKRPKDKSDLEFCRAYILYQKWKTIRKPDEWEKMDEVMYNLYERTPDSIKSNPVLKQILLPQNSSTLNTLIHLSEKHLIISEEYFKYIKSNKIQDDDISSAISDIEIQDDDFIPDMIGDAEDQELEKAHKNFIKSMSSTCLENDKSDECMDIKVESGSDDEECQIVGVTSLGDDPKGTDVIHEILDDDDDEDDGIIEIIYFLNKDEKQSISQEDKGEGSTLSFLESIAIPECRDVSIETVSSSTNNACMPLPAKVTNSGETSSNNAEVEAADSPTSKSFRRELSKEISKTNVVTSIAQTASVSETASLISELCKTVTHVETNSSHPSHIENGISATEATCDLPESNCIPSKKRNVVSTETQTDESELEKSTEQNGICRSYYYYGLDTPPSDQPEHILPVTESTYPVYANIVRTHSPDETDSLAKATETDSLSSSVDDNDIDNNSKSSPTRSVDLTPTSVVQNEPNDLNECSSQGITQYHTSLLDATFIQNIHKSLNTTSDLNGLCSNQRSDMSGMRSNSEESIDFHNRTKPTPNDFQLNDTSREGHSLSVSECRSTPQEQMVDVRDISSLDLNTNTYHRTTDTYSSSQTNLRSPSPFGYRDNNIPCTSPDFIITSAESSNILFSDRSKPADISNASPDVTSTSADVQDFNENQCNGEMNADDDDQLIYHHLNADVPEIEEHAVNNDGYCSEEEEIYIEGPILMSHDDELTYIVHDALSVGANVNICMEESPVNNLVSNSVSGIDQHKDTGQVKESEEKRNQSTYPLKELKISVEKIDVSPNNRNNKRSPKKITFTSPEETVKPSLDDSLKFGKKVHTKWNKLKETHNLDEIFCGPVSKIIETNGSINPAPNFDLFSSTPSAICGTSESRILENPSAQSNNVTTMTNEVMDDFQTYYKQSKNISIDGCTLDSENHIKEKNDIISSTIGPVKNGVCRPTDNGKVTGLLIPKTLKSLQDAGQSSSSGDSPICSVPTNSLDGGRVRSKNVKRVHIAETIMDSRNSVPQFTTESKDNVLRGILKKSLSERQRSKRGTFSWRIPIHKMNLRSLKQYNVEPDNIRIQSVPCVTVERLSDNEIAQWLRVSEISRKIRLEKQQLQYASSKSIKVDYNKRTSHINENDIVQYNNNGRIVKMSLPETFGQWRSNSVPQTKSNRLDEGTVTTNLNDNDCTNIPLQCKNPCCSSLLTDLTNLNVSISQSKNILNLSCSNSNVKYADPKCHSPAYNPFLLQSDTTKNVRRPEECSLIASRKRKYCDNSKLLNTPANSNNSNIDADVNLDSFFDKNLDCQNVSNIKSNLNLCQFNVGENQQPAIVPEVAEFEKAFKLEEVVKMSSIPPDLHNLNLRKFSPSPVIHCFSPQSDSLGHTFLSDTYIIDKPSIICEGGNDVKIQEYSEIDSLVKSAEIVDNKIINLTDTYSANTENLNINNINSQISQSSQNLNLSSITSDVNIFDAKNDCKEIKSVSKDNVKLELLTKVDVNFPENEAETRLPLKKRKLSVANTKDEFIDDDDFMGPDLVEEIIKRARAEEIEKEDISYPAKPMISIAEIQEKLVEPHPRVFKTPAERKEMPPPPPPQSYVNSTESPKIVTEQYNNHTYNNPTINYHMNNVPYPFFPCASLPYFPPILLPLNSTTTFDMNLMNPQQQQPAQQPPTVAQEPICRPKKERRTRGRRKNN